MSALQVDTAAGWSASAHRPDHDGLSEKRAHQLHMLPPHNPDINPVDHAIWVIFQQRVYQQRQFKTLEERKRATVTEWQKLSQRFIDNSINEWRRRLKAGSRMAADTSSIATWLEQPHIILTLSRDNLSDISLVNKTKHLTPISAVVFV